MRIDSSQQQVCEAKPQYCHSLAKLLRQDPNQTFKIHLNCHRPINLPTAFPITSASNAASTTSKNRQFHPSKATPNSNDHKSHIASKPQLHLLKSQLNAQKNAEK
jgi:hypothetical protein